MAEKLSSGQRGQAKVLFRVQQVICLFFVLLGTFLCLEKYLVSGISPWLLAAAASVGAAAAGIMSHGKLQKFLALLLFFLCAGMAVWRNQALLLEGGKEIANRVIYLVNQHYRTEYLYWFVEQEGKGKDLVFLLLCFFVGFLECVFVSFTKKKKSRNAAFLSMPVLAIAAGVLVGRTPYEAGLLLILVGFLALQLDLKVRGTRVLGAGMGIILLLAVLFAKSGMAQQILETYHAPWLQRQLHFEDQMLELIDRFSGVRLFSQDSAQKEYLLTNDEPSQVGKEIFQITMDERPKQAVYIRGFIGGDYEGGSWKSTSRQEFSDWVQEQGLSYQKCQEVVQNFPYWELKKLEEESGKMAQQVQMELKATVPGYTLVPYNTEIPENQPAVGDGSLAPGSRSEFQWDSFLFADSWQQEAFLAFNEWQQKEESADMLEEEEIWKSYRSYAEQVYTRLPGQGLEDLRKLAEEYAEKDFFQGQQGVTIRTDYGEQQEDGKGIQITFNEIWQKSQQTQELLWQNADYSQKLEPLPEGEDYAEYFLLKQKKGFCVHFATAGTLVLRMYGVPARYVSGYVVFPEDFRQNSDGTFTAVVKDERGHAWTEIFQEETGFYPLELTPPAYFAALQELQPGESVEDALEKLEGKEESGKKEQEQEPEQKQGQEDIPKEEEQEQAERNEKEEQPLVTGDQAGVGNSGENKETITVWEIGKTIIICLAGTCGLCFLLYCRRKWIEDRRRAEFFQENRARGALAMGKSMKNMLKSLGLEPKKDMSDLEYGTFLEQELPGMEWERIIFLLQKAAFSEHGITEEEFQEIAGMYRELEQKVHSTKQKKRKF